MEKKVCEQCQRFYSGGTLITTDWPYWLREEGRLICPECRGIDVAKEMEDTFQKMQTRE